MLLLLLAAFFCWLIFREFRSSYAKFDTFTIGYIAILVALTIASVRPAYKIWRLETTLSEKASIIADRPNVVVKCNSIFDTLFSGKGVSSPAGTAYVASGEIFFESGWCKNFMAYLDDPGNASREQIFAMHVYTHEIMHIRGELSEGKTDCQAIQRNHILGEYLGIDRAIARRNALRYYTDYYPRHPYFHSGCKPGGPLDERLPDSIWGG